MDERTAMRVRERGPGVARKPGDPRYGEQRARAAPRGPPPARETRRQQGDPGKEIDRLRRRCQSSSELRHSPENSDFVMNPRAEADSSRFR